MSIKNCARCGRMFQAAGPENLCSRCRNTDDEDFKVVRDYVYDNPSATIPEVAEETSVSEDKILKFLRQGRLMLKDEAGMVLDCERCGKAIKTGRFCDECTADMSRQLKAAATKTAQSLESSHDKDSGKGMHTKKR